MNNQRIFVDIHVIQTLPPSNVNRDDSGSPKTAQYGGVMRARVSSQAWKMAIRRYFEAHGAASLGLRTKRVVEYVAECIMSIDPNTGEEQAKKMAENALKKVSDKFFKNGIVKAPFFIGSKQASALAEAALRGETDKKVLHSALSDNPNIDIALFGRMLAGDKSLNEDASAQVAHAISTHAVQTEFDYFTAIDDISRETQTGAAMIDTIEYNSPTLYRYANVAMHELTSQLGNADSAVEALKLFVEAFSNSMPSGKINTFANATLPQVIMVNVRTDRPVNLVSAYEKPVKSTDGYVSESVRRLFAELTNSEKFVEKPAVTLFVSQVEVSNPPEGKEENSLKELLSDLDQIKSMIRKEA